MRRLHLLVTQPLLAAAAIPVMLSAGAVAVVAGQAQAVDGVWSGAISTPGASLAVVIRLQRAESGSWTGTIDIPLQRAKGIPLGDVTVLDRSVSFRLMGVPGDPTVRVALSDDGQQLAGTFSQGGATLPISLSRGAPASAR